MLTRNEVTASPKNRQETEEGATQGRHTPLSHYKGGKSRNLQGTSLYSLGSFRSQRFPPRALFHYYSSRPSLNPLGVTPRLHCSPSPSLTPSLTPSTPNRSHMVHPQRKSISKLWLRMTTACSFPKRSTVAWSVKRVHSVQDHHSRSMTSSAGGRGQHCKTPAQRPP